MTNKTSLKTSFSVTYIGGPTAIFEIDGLRIMTDPTLDPAGGTYHSGDLTHRKIKGPATIDIGRIDLVLLSHDQHFDNLDNAGRSLLQTVPKTYTTKIATGRLKANCVGLEPWQTTSVHTPSGKEVYITATPARHGPAGSQRLQGDVIGFLLDIGEDGGPIIYEAWAHLTQNAGDISSSYEILGLSSRLKILDPGKPTILDNQFAEKQLSNNER